MPRQWLLTQGNRDLRRHGISTWTLPAWVVQLPSGRHMNVCPSAGVCAKLCFARFGTYRIPSVRAAHLRNLMLTLDDQLPRFEELMTAELQHRRYQGGSVRIHDAGDFHSRPYLETWLRIMRTAPGVSFYCYTKEVTLFQECVETSPPANFAWCYSLGGREDRYVDRATMRHADVFPDEESITEAGYSSQTACDLLCVQGPPHVGIPANNIPHLKKAQGRASFGTLQETRDTRTRRPRPAPAAHADRDNILAGH
ncbi:hypothetical protein [Streptomyces sp. NPDC051098]|uniref:GP88 family protein n=1 Tax=Streptomyces sp. NPDC051098 TaxID=3155411 RepID=UPI003428130E